MTSNSFDTVIDQLLHLELPPQTTREANPLFLASLAMLRGARPPRLDKGFTCCELFAGQGLGATMAASVFSNASFYVLSPTPVNVVVGRDIAAQAGIENVHHLQAGLDDLQSQDIPPCDYICVHDAQYLGGPSGLGRLVPFLQRILAPGGMASISYHALPGMQEEMQIRQLLRRLVSKGQGDLDERLKTALKEARSICNAAGIMERLPQVAAMLERLEAGISPLMARELLHPDWQPLHFEDVNRAMENAGMRHLGQAALHYDIPSLLMSEERLKAFRPHENSPHAEYLKGLLAAQTMRYDVFHKGMPFMSPMEQGLSLSELTFARLMPFSQRTYEVPTPHGTVQLQPELVDPVYNALEQGSASYGQLMDVMSRSESSPELLYQVVAMLVDAGQLHPMLPLEEAPTRCVLLDRLLLERFIIENSYSISVAARLGGGMQLSWETQAMRLIQLSGGEDPENAVEQLLEQMENSGRRLVENGAPLNDPQKRRAKAKELWQEFLQETLPLLEFLQGPMPQEMQQQLLQNMEAMQRQ